MPNNSKSSHKSSLTKPASEEESSPAKSKSKSNPSKTNHSRAWLTSKRSYEHTSSGSKSAQFPGSDSGNANSNTQSSSSKHQETRGIQATSLSHQYTPMERWELEAQRESPWNGVGQFQNIGSRK